MINIKNITQHYPPEVKSIIIKVINGFDEVFSNDSIKSFGFCEPHIITIIKEIAAHYPSLLVLYDGGYEQAENQKVIVYPDYYGSIESGITILNVVYSKKFFKIEHRDVLGTILNNGIDHSRFGDIIVDDEANCNIIIDSILLDTLPYLIIKIANQKIEFIPINEMHLEIEPLKQKTMRVKSLRIDAIVKILSRRSRAKARILIDSKLVKLNYVVVNNPNKIIETGDIISIRGMGRVTIGNIQMGTKSAFNIEYK